MVVVSNTTMNNYRKRTPVHPSMRPASLARRARRGSSLRALSMLLARPLDWWRIAWLALYAEVNVALLLLVPPLPSDWTVIWAHVPQMLADGTLYAPLHLPFIYSPVLAWMLAPVLSLGFWPYVVLHIASAALVRSVSFAALMLVSWGFWFDTVGANTMTFVVVAGALALRGSRWGALAYLALCLLMPRPVQLPLAVWLLWKDRTLRGPFAGLFAAHAVLVLWTGYGGEWITAMVAYGSDPNYDVGLSALLGHWWLLVGVPLAAWLTVKGRPGWAGLALSPYVLPQYTLVVLWEVLRLGDLHPVGRHAVVSPSARRIRIQPKAPCG